MDQTMMCIMHAQSRPNEKKKILDCVAADAKCEIIIDRHRMSFDPESQTVTITRASDNVPFACKINGCRMKYNMLERTLEGDYSNVSEFEWLND